MNYRYNLILISCPAEELSAHRNLKVVLNEEVALRPHREPNPRRRAARWRVGGKGDEDCSEVDRSLLRRRRKGDHPSGTGCNLFDVSAGQRLISFLS
jgi:hypothetical protein